MLWDIDLVQLRDAVAQTRVRWLALAVALRLLTLTAASLRAAAVFGAVHPTRLQDQATAVLLGFSANVLFPLRPGWLMRTAWVARRHRVAPEVVLGSLGVERGLDLVALLMLAMLAWLGPTEATPLAWLAPIAAALGLFLIVRSARVLSWFERMPASLAQRLTRLHEGLGALRTPGEILSGLATTALIWGLQLATVACWLHAFGLSASVPLGATFLVAISLGALVPAGPAFAGPWHAIATWISIEAGATASQSVAFALVAHVTAFAPAALFASPWLALQLSQRGDDQIARGR